MAVTNPPLLPWICYAANLLSGRRYILLIHDVYPDIAVALGAEQDGATIEKLWRFLDRRALARAELVVVLGRDMRDVIASHMAPERHSRIVIIPNWADGTSVRPRNRDDIPVFDELAIRNKFVVQYSGNIGRFHEIETILDAAALLNSDDGFAFLFCGEGKQIDLVRAAARASAKRAVIHVPFQPRDKLGLTLTGCDVSLVTLKQGLAGLAVPSKLYGVLAAAKPVIVIGPAECEAARLVEEERCGAIVRPGDSQRLAELLVQLRDDPGRCAAYGGNARAVFERSYDIDLVAASWKAVVLQI